MTFPVKWYASQMQGAPSLGDITAGALTALLKAVLVTGFGNLTINALVWDATEGAAKATFSGGHAYLQDSVIEVTGVSPGGYNGEHRIKKVSSTEVWFELDAGNPGMAGSGAAMTMKVAPLGWTLTHESGDGMVAIYRPTNVSESGNVSLRIDNTAWTNWAGNTYLAKVQMVEDVVDINTYTLIADYRWPATQRYSSKAWDLIGDSQLFYWLPALGNYSFQAVFCFGYLKSTRPGDRYHALMNHFPLMNGTDGQANWSNRDAINPNYSHGAISTFNDTSYRVMARPYHQMFGAANWWIKGLFARFGTGLNAPNAPDNGFYLSTDPIMVLENNNQLRGYLPGLIVPYADVVGWDRRNFANLPALPGKIVRFIRPVYQTTTFNGDPRSLMGFDLTGPWR